MAKVTLRCEMPLALRIKLRVKMLIWRLRARFGWEPIDADYKNLARWIVDRMRITAE